MLGAVGVRALGVRARVWLQAGVAAAVMTIVLMAGCAPTPPTGSISEAQAKASAIDWISQRSDLGAWHETVGDPAVPVVVTYLDDDPGSDDGRNNTPVWSVEFTSPKTPFDPKEPASSVTVRLRMNGTLSSFEADDAP
jgi:hypothetical protein